MTVSVNVTLSLTNQNINVSRGNVGEVADIELGTDQIISLRAKIRHYPRAMRSFSLILKDHAYSVSFILFVCVLSVEQTPSAKAQAEAWPQPFFIWPLLSQLVPHLIYLECCSQLYLQVIESCQHWERSTASSRRLRTLLSICAAVFSSHFSQLLDFFATPALYKAIMVTSQD